MIAGGIQPIQTGVMSPMQGLQLRQLALGNQMTQADFADQQLARSNRVKLRDVFNQPDAFDPDTGAPTAQTIQRAGAIDPQFAMGLAREGHLTRVAAIREQNLQSLQDLREKQEDLARSRTEKLRIENMHSSSREFTTAALGRYQALVDQGAPPDAANEGWRQAWLDEIDQREKSGSLKAAGYTDAEIAQLKANVPTPDQAKQAMETSREREIRKKAELDNPIQQTRLAQTDRRLDQADQRLNQADVKAQTRNGGQTAAGVKLEKAPAGYRYVDGGAALEPIPGGPADKGTAGGSAKQGSAQYIKPPSGYQWNEDGSKLTPIPGGPADKPNVGGSPTLAPITLEQRDLHGPEFLATLKPGYAADIKAIAENRMSLKNLGGSAKERAQMAKDVLQYKQDYTEPPPRPGGATNRGVLWDKDTLKMKAEQVLTGDTSPYVGLNRLPDTRVALDQEVQRQAKARGMSGRELAAATGEFSGFKRSQAALGTRIGGVELGIETLNQMQPLVEKASAEYKRSNIKSLNDLQIAIQSRTASPELRDLTAKLNGFVNTYARTIGGGTMHVDDVKHAREMIDRGFSHGDLMASLHGLLEESRAEQQAGPQARQSLSRKFTHRDEAAPPTRETPQSPMPATPGKKTIKFGDLK